MHRRECTSTGYRSTRVHRREHRYRGIVVHEYTGGGWADEYTKGVHEYRGIVVHEYTGGGTEGSTGVQEHYKSTHEGGGADASSAMASCSRATREASHSALMPGRHGAQAIY